MQIAPLMTTETLPLVFFGFCCNCHSDLNVPSSLAKQNNFGLFLSSCFPASVLLPGNKEDFAKPLD